MKRSSIRVPPPCSVSRICTAVVGISAFGVPSWSANPSVNSSDLGGSTDVTRPNRQTSRPFGPVMTQVTSPPAARWCFSRRLVHLGLGNLREQIGHPVHASAPGRLELVEDPPRQAY